MRPHLTPKPTPDDTSPRIVSVEHPDLPGKHYFRVPRYAVCGVVLEHFRSAELFDLLDQADGPEDLMRFIGRSAALADDCAALVGVCWHHPEQELETPAFRGTSASSWRDYGAQVAEELEEAGYTVHALLACAVALWTHVFDRVAAASTEATEAAAGFPEGTAPSTGL